MKRKIESWLRPYASHPLAYGIDDALVPVASRAAVLFPIASLLTSILVYFLFRSYVSFEAPLDLIWIAGAVFLALVSATLNLLFRYLGDRIPLMSWLWLSLLMLVCWAFYWSLPGFLFLYGAHDSAIWLLTLVLTVWLVVASNLLSAFALHGVIFTALVMTALTVFWGVSGAWVHWAVALLPLIWGVTLLFAYKQPQWRFERIQLTLENEQLRSEQEQARQVRARLLGMTSGNLHQPLQAIELNLEQLPHHISTHRGRDLIQQLGSSKHNIEALLNSLSDLSMLDSDQCRIQNSHVRVWDVLQSVVSLYRQKSRHKGLIFNVQVGDDVTWTDPAILKRIVEHLLSNAVRYTPSGSIDFSIQTDHSGVVRVSVKDTGVGVSTADLGRIFDEFEQLQAPNEEAREGLGLGLNLASRFCDLLDVVMEFRSTPGEGTWASVLLPVGNATELPEKTISSEIERFEGLEVLLIEPDKDVRAALADALRHWGCRVKASTSRWEGLCLLDDGWRPQLVIADNGVDEKPMGLAAIVSVWQALNQEINAIILANHTSALDNETVREAGIEVLKKPVNQSRVREAISRLSDRNGLKHDDESRNVSGSSEVSGPDVEAFDASLDRIPDSEALASVRHRIEREISAGVEQGESAHDVAQTVAKPIETKPATEKSPTVLSEPNPPLGGLTSGGTEAEGNDAPSAKSESKENVSTAIET